MRLLLFIGIQATGKSTFWRAQFSDTHPRLTRDALKTRRREKILFDALLVAHVPFVLDNTNLTRAVRAPYLAAARAAGFEVHAYFFETTLADAIRRNAARSPAKRVPNAAIAASFHRLEPPDFSEGFAGITIVHIGTAHRFVLSQHGAVSFGDEAQR